MKNIGSVKEDLSKEKRISVTPDIIKKYTDLKFSVFIEKSYGEHLGIKDEEYKKRVQIYVVQQKKYLKNQKYF